MSEARHIAVVGAGPAGLMAAEAAATAGARVTVYDRMPSPARKFLMAGRGGLNLTHSEDLQSFMARYGPAADRLRPLIEAFPPEALRQWAEGLGETTFVGSSGRVFPRSFKASPLLRAWLRRLAGLGVELITRHRFIGFDGQSLRFEVGGETRTVTPDATVLALGGASWPRLGSDGEALRELAADGLTTRPFRPANAGLEIAWSEVLKSRFAGLPVKPLALTFAGQRIRGEAIVTAHGLEGGAVYALCSPIRDRLEAGAPAELELDLRPDVDLAALERRLSVGRARQSTSTFLRKAAGLTPVAAALLREAGELPKDGAALARRIKEMRLPVTGIRPLNRAISSAGGLSWEEVDARLMLRSRPGTFVAGEMLDWEAPTGGYLLQACFATGRWAGLAASQHNPTVLD